MWVQIPSREEQKFDCNKSELNKNFSIFEPIRHISLVTKLLINRYLKLVYFYQNIFLDIYILYVWKLNQTVLEFSCYSIFSFICMFCRSFFVLFLLAIVLSVLLRYIDSDVNIYTWWGYHRIKVLHQYCISSFAKTKNFKPCLSTI
jgi:hypothetical protein